MSYRNMPFTKQHSAQCIIEFVNVCIYVHLSYVWYKFKQTFNFRAESWCHKLPKVRNVLLCELTTFGACYCQSMGWLLLGIVSFGEQNM